MGGMPDDGADDDYGDEGSADVGGGLADFVNNPAF